MRDRQADHGFAMLLVLLAVVLAVTLAAGFLATQSTSAGIARNVNRNASARAIAESGLASALAYIEAHPDWRTLQTHGAWVLDQSLSGGTYTVVVMDGQDSDGDGVVESDGDLADDPADPATVIVTARHNGVAHVSRAVVTSSNSLSGSITLLMVVADTDSLTPLEESRKSLIESWGWTVTLVRGDASQPTFDTALTGVHVVYVPDDGGSSLTGTRLAGTELGVVYEEGDMNDELGLSSSQSSYTDSVVRIVDTTHYITSPFAIGELTVGSVAGRIEHLSGTVAGAARPLAWKVGTELRVVSALEVGQAMVSGSASPGRRALSPFSGFSMDHLTDEGKQLLKRTLEWGAQSGISTDSVTALNNWTSNSSIPLVAGEDRLLVVVAGAETHTSLTSLTYGHQAMTLACSAYESTGVGNRTYVYYLREANLQAASDSTLRATWTSGSRTDPSFASRLYAKVSQATPIRAAVTATNAGPPAITCASVETSRGDMVVSAARVGEPNRSYTWTAPLVEGLEEKLSSTTQTAADYSVPTGVAGVIAQATCNAPNRQAMATVVVQPSSKSSGGVIPQLLVLYEFDESPPDVELVGHWTLDDNGSGGAIALQNILTLSSSARIEGYRGAQGAFGGSNQNLPVTLLSNTNSNWGISLSNNAYLQGSTYNRPGANPSSVVSVSGSAVITGDRYEQSVQFTLPTVAAPTGMPGSQGDKVFNSGNHSINSDATYSKLTINNGAVVTVNGDVRVQVTGDVTMNGGSIVVSNGSRLRLYTNGKVDIKNSSTINADSQAVARFELHQYSNTKDTLLRNNTVVAGYIRTGRDLTLSDSAVLYGRVFVGDDLTMSGSTRLRVDLDQPGFGIVPVADATGTSPALAHSTVTFSQSGARAHTGTSIRFNGSNDFVRIPHHTSYLLDHGTVSFWFYSESLLGNRALFSKDSSGYDTGGHLHVYTSGNTLRARVQTSGSSPYGTGNDFEASASGLSTSTWYHVAVTLGAGGFRLYLNGALQQTIDYPGGLGASSGNIGNYQPIVLGAGTSTAGDLTHLPVNEHFQGRLDDVRIYNAVLDAPQVQRVYQGQDIGDRTEPSYLVKDTSGLGTALDLSVGNTQAVAWVTGGGLTFNSSTLLRSAGPPDKVRNGVTATGEYTLEAIVNPASLAGSGRLLWYGPNSGTNTNLDLYQAGDQHALRARTSTTGTNPPAISSDGGVVAGERQHLLVTFGSDKLRIYRNAVLVKEQDVTGNLLTWDSTYNLVLANLPLGTNPFLGTFERLAIYDRAMNQEQLENLNAGLPPGDGAGVSTSYQARWID